MNQYVLSDIKVGDKESFSKKITKDMEEAFRQMSGDENPLHKDDAFAVEVSDGKYTGHISFGMLTASLYSTLAGVYMPGKYSLIHSFDELSFIRPVFVGDELFVECEVAEKSEATRMIRLTARIKNQNNELVSRARMKIIVMK